jgi:hypothetical protein
LTGKEKQSGAEAPQDEKNMKGGGGRWPKMPIGKGFEIQGNYSCNILDKMLHPHYITK